MSTISDWLLRAPPWAIGLFAFSGMIVAALIGQALRHRHDHMLPPGGTGSRDDSEQGMMVSAVMGSLALLIAFTFSIAINRFDTRRVNVLNEANAIGTTYLRAQLLEQPHRSRMSKLLVDYTDARIDAATASPGPHQMAELQHSDALIGELWTTTVAAFPSMRPYHYSNSFLETMNNLIDMDATRKAGRQAHVPSAVFVVLFLYQFAAAAVISYVIVGKGGRSMALLLFSLLGILLVLIIDIDHPTRGGIIEPQEPMLQLRDFMKARPPESFN